MQNHQTQIPQNVFDYLDGACDGGCGTFFPFECLNALLNTTAPRSDGARYWLERIRNYLELQSATEADEGEGCTGAAEALQWFLSAARLAASGTARDRELAAISP